LIPVKTGAAGAGGVTDAAGKFVLKSGEGDSEGAQPGDYKVVITRFAKPDGTVIPPSPEKSPLQLMTEENAKESIPPKYSDFMRSKLTVTVPAAGGSQDFKLTSK
jgi:hypothetical protein